MLGCVCLIDSVKSNDREGRTALTFEEANEDVCLFTVLNFYVSERIN